MIIENKRRDISKVGTVVFYKQHQFYPDTIDQVPSEFNGYKSDLVKYHGSTTNFPGIDFAEYDFSYLPNKQKFNNIFLLSELDLPSGEIVGRNIEDANKVSEILFPTYVEENTENPYKYFGSLLVSGRLLYFFECPEDYATIEIYEEVLDSNIPGSNEFIEYKYLELEGRAEEAVEPSIIITLGPLRDVYNNPTKFYFYNDPLRIKSNRDIDTEMSPLDYSRLCDEIFSKKVICFFLSTDISVQNFNLAFSSFQNNQNPLRNKWKYDLRNDEFYNITKDTSGITNNGSMWLDRKSGTFLGNSEVSVCPIKDEKLRRLKSTQMNYYSPYRRYNRGDITIYKVLHSDNTFTEYNVESLTDGNIGNDPLLSPSWILKDIFLDFQTNIIYISSNPTNSGSTIDPGTQLTIRADSVVEFSISDGLGYSFSGLSIIDKNNEKISLTRDTDYTYTLDETDTDYMQIVRIDSWSDLIDPESPKCTENLVFDFTKRPSIIKFLLKKKGVIYTYDEWTSEFTDAEFNMTLKLNGNVIEEPGPSNQYISPISFTDGNMYLFVDNPESLPTLEIDFGGTFIKNIIESKYRIGNKKYTKTIEINNNEALDTINFSNSEYIIDIDSIEKVVSVRANRNLINCDDIGLHTVNHGSSKTISFSVINPNEYTFSIDMINFMYTNDGRLVKYVNDINISSCPFTTNLILDGEITCDISLSRSENTYYLSLSNITENTIVQISGNKII